MKDKSLFPFVASTKRSMCGSGKQSFRHALLRSVISTHTRHSLFFFFTTTGLASKSGYQTSVMDPTLRSFSTSSLTKPALGPKVSSLLLDRFESRVDVELVARDVYINPWHVICGPCERVQVLFQTSNKLNFQRLAQVRADFDTSVWECFV